MEGNMRQFNDENLKNMLRGMSAKAPDGLKSSIMQRVMVYKPRRSPIFWLMPATGVLGLALVLVISMGVFSSSGSNGVPVASNDNIPAAEILTMDTSGGEESGIFAARAALPDEEDTSAGNGMELAESEPSTLGAKAVYAREEVPIGGVVATSPSGYSTVNLSTKIQNSQSQTVMLLSGLHDNDHWKGILTELDKISDPFIRTDNYGNFMVDVGIFEESIEIFDEKVSSQLCYPEDADQGSVLFRVQVYK